MPIVFIEKATYRLACAVALLACPAMLFAQQSAAEAVPFAAAPESLRPYFVQAKAADSIADPLARCLAMPDMPANRWPAGLVKAHCEYARGPHLTQAEVAAMVERKAFAELEARFKADLDRHYAKEGSSEAIHRDFEVFDGGELSDKMSRLWLEAAPKSGFALAARGTHYARAAWEARGSNYASETEDWKLERMSMLASLAGDLLEQSVRREPKLIHSYEILMDMARLHGDDDRILQAFARGSRLDPLCRSLGIMRMASLRPRWGGSLEAMAAYSVELAPFQSKRPLIANVRAEYPAELAWAPAREKKHKEVVELLTPYAAESTQGEVHRRMGWAIAYQGTDSWTELVHLLQVVRFNDDADAYEEIGRVLQYLDEHEWALAMFERAARFDPNNALARARMARTQFWLKRLPEAEQTYRTLVDDPEYRRESLNALSAILLEGRRYDEALVQASALSTEFPGYAWGWLHKGRALSGRGEEKGAIEALRKFLETADRSDEAQAGAADHVGKLIGTRAGKK